MRWKAKVAAATNRVLRPLDIQLLSASEASQWRPLERLDHPRGIVADSFARPFAKSYRGSKVETLQEPANFAVVMQTMLRPKISDAVQSVFDQKFDGTVQLLIGVDRAPADHFDINRICRAVPDRVSVLFFYPGYSTSRRHGGVDPSGCGGALRTTLSYLANSEYVAYLDDDNWWSKDHLSSMHEALSAGAEWAWSLRWFVHPESRQPICRDEWESVGPGKGFFDFLGGWVDPNCLAINKTACEAVLRWWSIPRTNSMDSDRNVFRLLWTLYRGAPTGKHSVFYELSEHDSMHPHRLKMIGEERYRSFAPLAA